MSAILTLNEQRLAAFGWHGPPPLVYRGKLIDGSKRLAAARQHGHRPPPAQTTQMRIVAARWLCLAGHYERALTLELLDPRDSLRDHAAIVRLSQAELIGQRKQRRRPLKDKPLVIEQLRSAVARCRERGESSIALSEIEDALGRFSP